MTEHCTFCDKELTEDDTHEFREKRMCLDCYSSVQDAIFEMHKGMEWYDDNRS